MKKTCKLIFLLIVTIMLCTIVSTYVQGYNKAYENKQYRDKTVTLFNLIRITFQDKEHFNGENYSLSLEEKRKNNIIVGCFGGALVLYWIILLLVYEREDIYDYTYDRDDDDIKFLNKYNPMLAGCLVDNREVLARDVTAVVLNLIQKEVINMRMIPDINSKKEDYVYMIFQNKKATIELDEIERYVLSWIFEFYELEEVDLITKLKELSKRRDFLKHMKKLNEMSQKKLHEIGANINKTPLFLRIINVFIFIFSIAFSIVHIINNGFNMHIYESTIWLILFVMAGIIIVLPVVALIIHCILLLTALCRKLIKVTINRQSGKKIILTSFSIIALIIISILILYFVLPDKYICLDIFIIGMSLLIVRTDNLMTKHNKEMLNDYYCLQEIKYKIESYSLIKEEQVNYMKLWGEYLVYAVAFGIPIPIVNKLKGTYKEDEDIKYLLKCEALYYICKAWLEVMWQMEFKENRNKINLKELFKF